MTRRANGPELGGRRVCADCSIIQGAQVYALADRPVAVAGVWRRRARQNRVSYSDRGYDRGYDRYEDYDHRYRRSLLLTVVDTDHDPALCPTAQDATDKQRGRS